ncbi:hypothetical protein [Streptomyces sp. NPDC088348]|uniref:hypothetical protein n=1 Tax=Streptomyces sp. NPDC088348 TaxID=3365853 RepID=UPI0037F7D084
MELDRRPEPEGCLTAAIRVPVRIVVLVVVLPVRMVWDALSWVGRQFYRYVLTPLGRVVRALAMALFVWPWAGLWRWAVVPAARWVHRWVLTPLGHPMGALGRWAGILLGWVGRALFVRPWVALWRYVVVPVVRYGLVIPLVWLYGAVLTPLGHALAWAVRGLGAVLGWLAVKTYRFLLRPFGIALAFPLVVLWRYVLVPVGRALGVVGREIGGAVGVCWRIAGRISRAVGRGLKWLGWNLVGRPVRAAWRWSHDYVLAPAGRAVADAARGVRAALRSARATVRDTRREVWRALFGGPAPVEAREPIGARARTLGSTTTVPEVAPEPEISLRKQG